MAARKKKTDPLQECLPMLRALADATRIEIVRLLVRGSQPVAADPSNAPGPGRPFIPTEVGTIPY